MDIKIKTLSDLINALKQLEKNGKGNYNLINRYGTRIEKISIYDEYHEIIIP